MFLLRFLCKCYGRPASDHGEPRGNALPLLLDLNRISIFLHDGTIKSLDELFISQRGKTAPHPFYISNKAQIADIIEFLRGLDTNTAHANKQ